MQVHGSARQHAYTGCVEKSSEDKSISSKCLNETSRAVLVKLTAATLLASVGIASDCTWSVCCQAEPDQTYLSERLCSEIDAEKIIPLAGVF